MRKCRRTKGERRRALVDAHLARVGKTMAENAPLFDRAVAVNAKFLIGLMVPPFALLLPRVFWRRPQPLAVHMVFALHFYAFFLVLFCVPLVVMDVSGLMGGPAVPPLLLDQVLSAALALACAAYLYVAMGAVYGTRGVARVVQTAVLIFPTTWIFLIYRVLLLPITLYTT